MNEHEAQDSYIARNWMSSVYLMHYGYEVCLPGHTFGPTMRSHYLIHYVLSGEGTFQTGGQTYQLQKDDLFIIRPGEITIYAASRDNPWTYCWLSFQLDDTEGLLAASVLHQPSVQWIFRQVMALARQESSPKLALRANILTYEFLSEQLQAASPRRACTSAPEFVKSYLDATYMDRIRIESIAKNLHLDRRYMTELFRQKYGLSPQAYLMELRLKKARKFLQAGYSVSDAAAMAGFQDLANFSKQYKRRFGCSPRQDTAGQANGISVP